MKVWLLTCLALISCGDSLTSDPPLDAAPLIDSGVADVRVNDAGHVVSLIDSSPDTNADSGLYVPCVKTLNKPTKYPRLLEIDCIDSDGVETFVGEYFDTQLQINCQWKVDSNLQTSCLPTNEQGDFEYSDSSCTKKMVLVGTANGVPLSKYVGVDDTINGIDYVAIYDIGIKWFDDGIFYYQTIVNGQVVCNDYYFKFPDIDLYHVGMLIDPATFVSQ